MQAFIIFQLSKIHTNWYLVRFAGFKLTLKVSQVMYTSKGRYVGKESGGLGGMMVVDYSLIEAMS